MMDKPTYAPSFRGKGKAEKRQEEMVENIENFNDELPDVTFEVVFSDDTKYELDEWEPYAVIMEYGEENIKDFLNVFTEKVEEHYDNETELTKYGEAEWGQGSHDQSREHYDNMSELAPVILYPLIRSSLMQISLIAMSGDDEPVNVVNLSSDSISYYGEHGKVVFES